MYSREDVTARSLANGYSQTLGTIFGQELKPFEVEIMLAQVGQHEGENELYRIAFDGTIFHEHVFIAIGGKSESLLAELQKSAGNQTLELQVALQHCVSALKKVTEQDIPPSGLEVATLDRTRQGRKFRRLSENEFSSLLS